MTTKELINKSIAEVRIRIAPYSYEGAIPLEQIEVEIKLSNKLIIQFPDHPEIKLKPKSEFTPNLKIVYPQTRWQNVLNKKGVFDQIDGNKIKGIWKIGDDFGEDICGLELSNGAFLVKGALSPIGTGNADLFLFSNKENLKVKYENEIELIHGA